VARAEDEAEGMVAEGAGLEDEDEDEGVVSERERKRSENVITSLLRVVAASGLTLSPARLGVKKDSEGVVGEGTFECVDFEEKLAGGSEAMGERLHFCSEKILPRRDVRGRGPSDRAEREVRLGLADRKDAQGDGPSGFGDGGVEMSVALSCPQRPRSNLR
jgi:hypothetical protein